MFSTNALYISTNATCLPASARVFTRPGMAALNAWTCVLSVSGVAHRSDERDRLQVQLREMKQRHTVAARIWRQKAGGDRIANRHDDAGCPLRGTRVVRDRAVPARRIVGRVSRRACIAGIGRRIR